VNARQKSDMRRAGERARGRCGGPQPSGRDRRSSRVQPHDRVLEFLGDSVYAAAINDFGVALRNRTNRYGNESPGPIALRHKRNDARSKVGATAPGRYLRLWGQRSDLACGQPGGRRCEPKPGHPDRTRDPEGPFQHLDREVAVVSFQDPEDRSEFGPIDASLGHGLDPTPPGAPGNRSRNAGVWRGL
jgi:hypothetical protein